MDLFTFSSSLIVALITLVIAFVCALNIVRLIWIAVILRLVAWHCSKNVGPG